MLYVGSKDLFGQTLTDPLGDIGPNESLGHGTIRRRSRLYGLVIEFEFYKLKSELQLKRNITS